MTAPGHDDTEAAGHRSGAGHPPPAPTTDSTDSRADGVRVAYRARVPRHLLGAALAEAIQAIHTTTSNPIPGPDDLTRTDSARTRPDSDRRAQVRAAVDAAFDIPRREETK